MDIMTGIKIYEGTSLEIDFHDFFDVNKRDLTVLNDLWHSWEASAILSYLLKVSNQKTSHLHCKNIFH